MSILRRTFFSILTALALFLLLWTSLSTSSNAQSGAQPGRPLDIILLLDNSRSMIRSDPTNLRGEAARMFVDYVSLLASSENPPRVGVISYGGNIGRSVTLRLASDASVRAGIERELIEYTDFPLALQAAYDEFQQSGTFAFGRQGIVILMTDGRPCTIQLDIARNQCVGTPEDFISGHFQGAITTAVERLHTEGVALHVLGLGNEVEQDKTRWEALSASTDGAYVSAQTAEGLFDAYHRVVDDLLSVQTDGPFPISAGANSITLTLPYRQSAAFTFVQADLLAQTSPERSLTLIGPSGPVTEALQRRAGNLSGGLYEIYHLLDPAPGIYTATLTGSDGVLVWVDTAEPVLDVLPIPHLNYVGSPIEIEGRLVRNGQPVTDSLEMALQIKQPDGKIAAVAMEDADGDGIYSGAIEQTSLEGDYNLTMIASVDGVEVQRIELARAFSISALPFVESVQISPEHPEENQEVAVSIGVNRSELLRQPVVELAVRQGDKVIVNEEVVGVGGRFETKISGLSPDSYQLVVTLPNRAMPPQAGANTMTLLFDVAARPTPTPTPAPIVIELGELQTTPQRLYSGNAFTASQPISVSGFANVELELVQSEPESHTVKMVARNNGYEAAVERLDCTLRLRPLNLFPCYRQSVSVNIRGVTENGIQVDLEKQGSVQIYWPLRMFFVAAIIVLIVLYVLFWLFKRIRWSKFWRRYFTKKGRRWYGLLKRGQALVLRDDSKQDTGFARDLLKETQEYLNDLNGMFERDSEEALLQAAKQGEMNDTFLIVNAIYDVRNDKPVQALRYIQQLARRGWYEQAIAGAILHDLLQKQNGFDREFNTLIESIDDPAMVNVWRLASILATKKEKISQKQENVI